MARKIGVLAPSDDPKATPKRQVKKCVAEMLVRRALAVRISREVIQMVRIRDAAAILLANKSLKPICGPVPKINPPRNPENLLLTYPHKDQRTLYGASL